MIPKIIHYCWFGGNPLPPLALECIASWRKFFPDYEIWEWSEGTTPALPNRDKELMPDKVMAFDVNIIPYTEEAYKQKKYAFVSDYARFWIMYKYGGVYFDTDVEVIRSMDDILDRGPFMGYEMNPRGQMYGTIAPGLGMGCAPSMGIIHEFVSYYGKTKFEFVPGTTGQITVVHIASQIFKGLGLSTDLGIQNIQDIWIYPSEYFCPINVITNRIHVEKETRTIHHYAGTWMDRKFTWNHRIKKIVPESLLLLYNKLKSKMNQ